MNGLISEFFYREYFLSPFFFFRDLKATSNRHFSDVLILHIIFFLLLDFVGGDQTHYFPFNCLAGEEQ